MRTIPASLCEAEAAIAKALHWPSNLGVELARHTLLTRPETEFLAVFIRGLADDELIRARVIDPLHRFALEKPDTTAFSPTVIKGVLGAPRLEFVTELSAAVEGVLEGATALFFDGAGQAVLVETFRPVSLPSGSVVSEQPFKEAFDPDLLQNVALLRKRLRSPDLLALPLAAGRRADSAALVYLKGRASPDVVEQVRTFVERKGGEEAMRRGLMAGTAGKWGLMPRLLTTRWPDRAASLLDAGYVVALVDRIPRVYMAPVTAPALLYGALDETLVRPLATGLRLFRLILAALITVAPALVVALMNYHQEMMPTPFVLALAAVREQSPFPIALEVLLLELMQELIREVGFHLPLRVGPGAALVAGKIMVLILIQGGIVGTVPGFVSVAVAFASYMLEYEVIYLARLWRFLFILGAAAFGFFGVATVIFILAAYLTRAESFGVPFVGETGLSFTTKGGVSSRKTGGDLLG